METFGPNGGGRLPGQPDQLSDPESVEEKETFEVIGKEVGVGDFIDFSIEGIEANGKITSFQKEGVRMKVGFAEITGGPEFVAEGATGTMYYSPNDRRWYPK